MKRKYITLGDNKIKVKDIQFLSLCLAGGLTTGLLIQKIKKNILSKKNISLPQQSLYASSSGETLLPTTSPKKAQDLLKKQLGQKYGGEIWESTLKQRLDILAPFIPILNPNKFYVTTSLPIQSFRNMSTTTGASFKPNFKSIYNPNITSAPLWFAPGYEWINFIAYEMPNWLYDQNYIYEITLNTENILKISTYSQLIAFTNKYGSEDQRKIQWDKIVKQYSGILIAPYIQAARMELDWYYPWDVASGCVWNWNGVKEIKLLNQREDFLRPDTVIIPFGGEF